MEEGGEGGDGEEEADAETERLDDGRDGGVCIVARPNRSRLLSASDLDRGIAAAAALLEEERLAGIAAGIAAATGRGRSGRSMALSG